MIEKFENIYLGTNAPPTILECTEGDTMWRWHFRIYFESQRWKLPNDSVVMFTGKKSDGNVFDLLQTVEDNDVLVTCDEQMTAAVGPVPCVLRFIDANGKTVASAPIVLAVKPNPQTMGTMSETVLSAYNDVLQLLGGAISVPTSVSAWLEEHITNPSNPPIDTSLTVSGAAADAKATGDAVGELKSALISYSRQVHATEDLNTFVTNGIWGIASSAVADILNMPEGFASSGVLICEKGGHSGAKVATQIIIGGDNSVWTRTINADTQVQVTAWALIGGTVYSTIGNHANGLMSQNAITQALNDTLAQADTQSAAQLDTIREPTANVWTYGDQSFIKNKTITFDSPLPAGKCSVGALVTSTDTDDTSEHPTSAIAFITSNGKIYGYITRGSWSSTTVTLTAEATSCVLYAGHTNSASTGDTATWENILIASGTDYGEYIPPYVAITSGISSRYFGKTVAFFGDSRTWYDGETYRPSAKPEWTGKICVGYQRTIQNITGLHYLDYGVNGGTAQDIYNKIKAVDLSGCAAVYLSGGVNTYIKSSEAVGAIAPIGSTFDTTTAYGAWQAAIEYLMANYPALKIYIDTPFPAWKYISATTPLEEMPESIAEIKKNVAALYGLPCLDLYHESGLTTLNRDYFFCDANGYIHLNDYGNEKIGEIIAGYIVSH